MNHALNLQLSVKIIGETEMEANKCLKMQMIESNMEDCFKAMNRLIEAVNGRDSGEKIPIGVMDEGSSMKSIAEHFISLMERVMVRVPEHCRLSLDPELFQRALAVDSTVQAAVFDGSRDDLRTASEFLVRSQSYCEAIDDVLEKLL